MTFLPIDLKSWAQRFRGQPPGGAPLAAVDRDRLRAHQIGAVIALSPAMMAANLVNCAITVLLFRNGPHHAFLTLWAGALVIFLAVWLRQWLKSHGRPRERASARGTRRIAVMAALVALMWAGPTLFLFADATDAQRAMIASSQAGMMTGGAIALATVWEAAAVYFLVIEFACLTAFVLHGGAAYFSLAAMSAIFALVIAAVVAERGRMFVRMHLANRQLSEKSDVISLLLREFEANASDWLFEVDAQARFVRVSERLAALLGEPVRALEGRAIASYLAEDARHASYARLVRAFRGHHAVRDIVVPVSVRGEARVWSLSARPVFDADGAFRGFLGVGSDVTEAHRAEASIQHMANYDQLTGLPNRTLLHAHLDAALARMKKDGRGFALLSLDLDRFKQVNDTLGHAVGDRLLVEVGHRIVAELREDDIVARFGGDEFVVLQQSAAEAAQADALARRLVEVLSAPYEIDGQRLLVGASAGIALAPADGDNGDDLMRNSDLALYRAKTDGRGAHRFFSAEMHAVSQARRIMEIELREALQAGALEVHFQPLVDLDDAEITACEALARWRHPTRGFIPPVEFVPLAEETGLILQLGAFVLRRACEAAVGWRNGIRVAVNLSAIQFKTGDLVGLVKTTLAETGLEPNRLELEITESILIDDKDGVLRRLSELRGLGVRIALDDFGTGYSSLAYLQSFPFDKIKIDRSFVQDVVMRPDAAAIIGAITGLATKLGMCTTAEGVETEAELDWLRDNGCGQVQGFLISRPLPPKAIALLMRARTTCTSRRDLAA
jgi:diguanylate cyclase (GGDEF)-like protein/PAS domain S-box-containing protein